MHLFTFTKEIFELKLHFLCSEHHKMILIRLFVAHTQKSNFGSIFCLVRFLKIFLLCEIYIQKKKLNRKCNLKYLAVFNEECKILTSDFKAPVLRCSINQPSKCINQISFSTNNFAKNSDFSLVPFKKVDRVIVLYKVDQQKLF